jgi:hypothetical protein
MYFRTMLDDRFFTIEQLAALRRHGYEVDEDLRVELANMEQPWVSAGGLAAEEAFRCVETWYDETDIESARYLKMDAMPGHGWPLPRFEFQRRAYDKAGKPI